MPITKILIESLGVHNRRHTSFRPRKFTGTLAGWSSTATRSDRKYLEKKPDENTCVNRLICHCIHTLLSMVQKLCIFTFAKSRSPFKYRRALLPLRFPPLFHYLSSSSRPSSFHIPLGDVR